MFEDVPGDGWTAAAVGHRWRCGFDGARRNVRGGLPAQQGGALVEQRAGDQFDPAVVELAAEEARLNAVKVADQFNRRAAHQLASTDGRTAGTTA